MVSGLSAPRAPAVGSGEAVAGCARLGVVDYLNAEPLVYGLAADRRFTLRRATPSRVAEDLHAGRVDLGLIPSIEYPRGEYAIVPDIAIASRGPVRSVALFLERELASVRRVAVDTSSRASVALLRVLLAERLSHDVEFVPMGPSLATMLAAADAALLIGDAALDAPAGLPRVDLGQAWSELTGLPFVFAFWAGPAGRVSADQLQALSAAALEGRAHLDAVARNAAPGRADAESYLRQNIVFDLGRDERRGLMEFYRRAARAGLIPEVPELRFHGHS